MAKGYAFGIGTGSHLPPPTLKRIENPECHISMDHKSACTPFPMSQIHFPVSRAAQACDQLIASVVQADRSGEFQAVCRHLDYRLADHKGGRCSRGRHVEYVKHLARRDKLEIVDQRAVGPDSLRAHA